MGFERYERNEYLEHKNLMKVFDEFSKCRME